MNQFVCQSVWVCVYKKGIFFYLLGSTLDQWKSVSNVAIARILYHYDLQRESWIGVNKTQRCRRQRQRRLINFRHQLNKTGQNSNKEDHTYKKVDSWYLLCEKNEDSEERARCPYEPWFHLKNIFLLVLSHLKSSWLRVSQLTWSDSFQSRNVKR